MDFESLFRDELGDLNAADDVDYVSLLLGDEWVDASETLGAQENEEIALNGQELEIKSLESSQQKRKKKTNPNKARAQYRAELANLRREVGDLEFVLKRLETIRRQEKPCSSNAINSKPNGGGSVWRDACIRHMEQRLRVERENSHLKDKYMRTVQVLKSLENLVHMRPAVWGRMYPEACIRTRRIDMPSECVNRMTTLIFDEISAGVENTYRAVKSTGDTAPTLGPVLRYMDDGRVEAFDCTIVPFSMLETGEAWWQDWHIYKGHTVSEDSGAVVKESYGLESVDSKTNTAAIFYVQQILQRHIECHRIVYVWNTYTEPLFFKGKRVTGVYYREHSYVLIEPVKLGSSFNEAVATQISSRESFTTHFLDPKLKKDARITALTKFVANSMPPFMAARNDMIENLLLDKSLQNRR